MPVEKLSGLRDHHEQAAMIAADRESDTGCVEARGRQFLHRPVGHYPHSRSASEFDAD
jgi:hypothetical protein